MADSSESRLRTDVTNTGWRDISVCIRTGMVHWPTDPPVGIERTMDMAEGAEMNLSRLSLGAHTGTHVDAPRHFIAHGRSVDQMPLDVGVGPARVVEIEDKTCIKLEELARHRIRRGERILFKTRNSRLWRQGNDFSQDYVFLSPDAAAFLAQRGVRLVGVDYLSVAAFGEGAAETHRTLLGAGVWIVEGLDLSGVEAGSYDLVCLPLKIANGDGAPARALLRPRRGPRVRP